MKYLNGMQVNTENVMLLSVSLSVCLVFSWSHLAQ